MFLKTVILTLAFILTACQFNAFTLTPEPTTSGSAEAKSTPATLEVASSSQPISQPAPQPTSLTTPRPQGGTAVLGLLGQPDSLNPITDSNLALRELTPLLYDSLLQADPQTARLQPNLAENWEYVDAGQQVVFYLPPNLKWSDGAPMTADTVADSLKATQHPALRAFSNIDAPNDTTLALTFKTIDCSAVTSLALLPLLPASQITATLPVGSGPFIVEEWPASKRTLTLARNPHYRQPSPPLDNLIVRFLRDNNEVAIALSEGQFDVVGSLAAIPPEFAAQQFTDITYPAPQVVYVAVNYDPKNGDPLSPEIRRALLLAPDRATILAEALGDEGQLMAGSLLPGHWAANIDLPLPDYDPESARDLLRRAGLRDTDGDGWLDQAGKRLELGIRLNGQNELYQNLGWLLSSYYRDLGLFVRAESVPVDSVIDDLFTHDFSLALFSWPILPDPDQRLYWHSTENTEGIGLNFTSYNNAEVDSLLEEAIAIPRCQMEERSALYADLQKILAKERPVDFLLAPNRHLLVADRLKGVEPGSFAPFTWNVTEWYLLEE